MTDLGSFSSDFPHDLGQVSIQLSDLLYIPSQFLKIVFLSLMCWYHKPKLHYCQKTCHRSLAN